MGCEPPTRDTLNTEDQAARLPGWPRTWSRARRRQAERESARAERLRIREEAWRGLEDSLNSIELGSSCRGVSAVGERRMVGRTAGMVLEDQERDAARTLAAAARSCGSSFVALRGYETGPGLGRETRMVCRRHCGTRQCDECAERIRSRQAFRVQGAWNTFLTFTVPRDHVTLHEAWKSVHEWTRILLREIRRERAIAIRRRAPKQELQREQWEERRRQARRRVMLPKKLEYAWAIEAQEDGWPHVHMVINWKWIDYAWTRYTWASAMGAMDAMVDGRRVFQKDGVCAYLCKYIAKGRLSLDILAILKGRRMWASTVDAPIREESKWLVEEGCSFDQLLHQVKRPEQWASATGWTFKHGKEGEYSHWVRALGSERPPETWLTAGAITEDELPEDSRANGLANKLELYRLSAKRDEESGIVVAGRAHT